MSSNALFKITAGLRINFGDEGTRYIKIFVDEIKNLLEEKNEEDSKFLQLSNDRERENYLNKVKKDNLRRNSLYSDEIDDSVFSDWNKIIDTLIKDASKNKKKEQAKSKLNKQRKKWIADWKKFSKSKQLSYSNTLVNYIRIISDVTDLLEMDKSNIDKDIKETRDYAEDEYKKNIKPDVDNFRKKLEYFCSNFGEADLNVTVEIGGFQGGMQEFTNPNFYVEYNKSPGPGFTVFTRGGGKYEIDDVIDFNDSDFFNDGDLTIQGHYFALIEFLRTGKIPEMESEKEFIKLYRGMSIDEYDKWERGKTIESGKFFTSDRTSQHALDTQGEFPQLFSFKIDLSIIVQTSSKIYQLTKDAKMKNGKIVKK